jgi:hypothetical protein
MRSHRSFKLAAGEDGLVAQDVRVPSDAVLVHQIRKEAPAMSYCHLRVYHGPEEPLPDVWDDPPLTGKRCVTLPVGDVLPLLADAIECRRNWLGDFEEDEITISTDLYEVLLAYQHFRRPSA